jgi:hypothetical protein
LHNATSAASFRCEAGPLPAAVRRVSGPREWAKLSPPHIATLRQWRGSLQDTPFNRKRRDSAGDDAALGGHVTDLRITENDDGDGAGQLALSHHHRPAQANGPSHAYAGSG